MCEPMAEISTGWAALVAGAKPIQCTLRLMSMRSTPIGMLLLPIAGALCQTPPDHLLFAAFFGHVSGVELMKKMLAKGDFPATFKDTLPNLQEAIGLTDEEYQTLSEIAADYDAKATLAMKGAPIFEARLQVIDSGKMSPAMIAKLEQIEQRRKGVTMDHIQQLREAFGDIAFQKVDAYVHGPEHVKWQLPAPLLNPK